MTGLGTMTSAMNSAMTSAMTSATSVIDADAPLDAFFEHRYAGILPAYFIKPDPIMTRQETRRYIREELKKFLTGPALLAHAQAVYDASPARSVSVEELRSYLADGCWPAARLVVLARLLGSSDMADVGAVALAICQSHLDVSAELEVYHGEEVAAAATATASEEEDSEETVLEEAEDDGSTDGSTGGQSENTEDVNHVALGFIFMDRLPGGKTIRPFWDHSPFEALRRAPPLTSSSSTSTSIEERIQYTITEFLEPLTTLQVPIVATLVVALAAAFLGYAIGRG